MERLKIAKEIIKIAEDLVFADSDYIYDPDHKKHPGGGYHKTEKGWSKLEERKENDGGGNIKMTPKQKQLDKLVNNKSKKVRMRILDSQEVHPSTLAKLADDITDIRYEVARNPKTPPEALEKLANDSWSAIRAEALKNPNMSTDFLNEFASQNHHHYYLSAVAQNPKLSSDMLEKLSTNENANVRKSVASNSNTPIKILEKLSEDENEYVRGAVAENPSTPDETLEKMSKVKGDGEYGPSYLAFVHLEERKEKRKKEKSKQEWQNGGFDLSKLSPEMREKVKDWDAEDIAKFIGWLKENKG